MMTTDHPERPTASTMGGRSCRTLYTAALGSLPSVALFSAVRRPEYLNQFEPARSRGLDSETPQSKVRSKWRKPGCFLEPRARP